MATLQGNQSCSLWWLVSSLGLRASGHLSWATSEWLRTQHQPSTCTWGRWNGQECEYLGPDYLGRAGPLGRRLPTTTAVKHTKFWLHEKRASTESRDAGSEQPASRVAGLTCSCVIARNASPSGRVCNAHAHCFNHDGERQGVQIDYGNVRRSVDSLKKL